MQQALSNKKIIVPSFETTGGIIKDHFIILRELRHKINLLKQAYFGQNDLERTWEQVDEILNVLGTDSNFLDFPSGKNI